MGYGKKAALGDGGGVSALLGNTGVSQMKTDKVQLLLHQGDSKVETELFFWQTLEEPAKG